MIPELRPRGIGEMLDAAVTLYRARFLSLIRVAAAVVVPVQVLVTLVLLSAQPDRFGVTFTGTPTPQYDSSQQSVQFAASMTVLVLSVLSTAFIVAVCTRIVADAYVDHDETAREAVRTAGRRVFAVLGVSIIVAVSEGLGVLACLVGVLVPLTLFAVAVPALILEQLGVFRALGRSASLARPHFWRVLGLVLSAQLLGVILQIGLTSAIGAGLRASGSATALVIAQGAANTIASTITTPFLATAIVSLYFDLRIRNEAFDVQLLLNRVDARRTPDTRAPGPAAAAR